VSATRSALAEAVRRKVFVKGFKSEVRVAADLVDATDGLLERAALDALAIAGKAGQAICGFSKVAAAIERDDIIGIVHARDAAADGIRKLDAALRRRADTEQVVIVDLFTSSQLDLALGRSNVIHAALLAGAAAKGFLAQCLRLKRFRGGNTGNLRHDDRSHGKGPERQAPESESE
jgi:hypothetical protein